MTYEITGTLKAIMDTQTFESGFCKREFVVCDDAERYPQDIKLEAIKDKCDELNRLAVGDKVSVAFNLRGNEYNGKYYTNLQAWKITPLNAHQGADPMDQSQPQDEIDQGGPVTTGKMPF